MDGRNLDESGLKWKFAWYGLAFMLFFGINLIYQSNNPIFDFMSGFLVSVLVFQIIKIFKTVMYKKESMLSSLLSLRKWKYDVSSYYSINNIWPWAVPIIILPFLLYKNDVPSVIIKFGVGFGLGYLAMFMYDIYSRIKFYKLLDGYLDWEKIQTDSIVPFVRDKEKNQ